MSMTTPTRPLRSVTALEVLRRRAGLQQWRLAELVGRDQSDISYLENGRHGLSPALAARILTALREALPDDRMVAVIGPEDLQRPWDEVIFAIIRPQTAGVA